ncbi:diacylglycerol O-acyltransferase 1-like isoform X2 [Xenia sp. Carnegie-2017]|uniref:diacylglycerol O-acyltransferase 1-like isoform X2 n=1 Tax=Xenia sp. Carnegie-2017 TaxID=2897299 RepID=UPI001F042545|nr:diacylglycerol O-acyltransferase 1-like isoform X2 [Xenia sp. Carnegie-2017]
MSKTDKTTRKRNVNIATKPHDVTTTTNNVQAQKADYDKRIHSMTESLLSFSSGFQNYRGLLNNCIVLLVLSSFRLALDNLLKYGILFDPMPGIVIFLAHPQKWPSACLVLASNINIQVMFLVEKLMSKGKLTYLGSIIHTANLACLLIVPATIVLLFQPPPWYSSIALIWYTILWLKYISYISVNKWLREGSMTNPPPLRSSVEDSPTEEKAKNGRTHTLNLVKYPENLTQKDLYYFLAAPTLCYELNFPRTKRIRIRFLLRRTAEFLFLIGVILAIIQQWMIPTITNSLKPFREMDYPRVVERIMKLAVPNHMMWLIFFYCFFHSFLNILAEILKFGDRTFYKDWWNASTIQQFWKTWNIPVHRWAQRHFYFPLRRRGYNPLTSSVLVFLLSAFFHEFLVSIPLQMFRPWAFIGITAQIPLATLTGLLPKNTVYGNFVVWLSLIMGQPIAFMMYGHDYYVINSSPH